MAVLQAITLQQNRVILEKAIQTIAREARRTQNLQERVEAVASLVQDLATVVLVDQAVTLAQAEVPQIVAEVEVVLVEAAGVVPEEVVEVVDRNFNT